MMGYAVAFAAGVVAYWLFRRFATFCARRWFNDGVTSKSQQRFFERMTYTQLRGFRRAVDAELEKRQAPR